MKRFFVFVTLSVVLIIPFSASAQMDNLANMSAKWIRSNVRNAALDGADLVNYNPAGLVKLTDGFHMSLNNQTLFRKPQHSFNIGMGAKSYEQDGADPFLPALYAAFKKNKWAISTGIYVTGGGSTVNYTSGSLNTTLLGAQQLGKAPAFYTQLKDQSLKGSSYYLAVPVGFSYAISEKLSLSLGGRYIRGLNSTKAGLTLTTSAVSAPDYAISVDYDNNASGFGGIFGINYAPTEKLNIAIHYETKVKLEFEAEGNSGNTVIAANGTKSRRDLPAVLYTGIHYKFTEKLSAGADFNYYFQENADWGKITDPRNGSTPEAAKVAGNCYTANVGLFYQLNEKLQLSAGCKYTAFLYDDVELYYTKLGLYEAVKYNNFNVGLGAGYNVTKNVQVDLGIGRTFWKDKTINSLLATGAPVKITDKGYVVALGVDIAF